MSEELEPQVPGETQPEQAAETPEPAAPEAEPEKKPAAKPKKAPGLPAASAIDATKIERAVLTEDGWVVPDRETPAARAKL